MRKISTLSFVIPVYNEEKRLNKTFKALEELRLPAGLQLDQVIFVNDGSTDKTPKRIEQFALSEKNTRQITLLTYSHNRGKGYAIRTGMLHSKADYTLFFDADMSTPLSEIEKFIPFMKKHLGVIIGTRKNGRSTVLVHQPRFREVLGKGFTRLTQKTLQIEVSDFTCGFKAYSKEAKTAIFSNSRVNGWGYDAENIFLAAKYGLSMTEIAVLWSDDKRSRVKIYRDVPRSLWELIQIRWIHTIRPGMLKGTQSALPFRHARTSA